ncbi:MAG: hypothetical protein EOP45_16315, partial [Sphingobacteriaceae bacterium]
MGVYFNCYLLHGSPITKVQYAYNSVWHPETVCSWDESYYLIGHKTPLRINTSLDHQDIERGYVRKSDLESLLQRSKMDWPTVDEENSSVAKWWTIET